MLAVLGSGVDPNWLLSTDAQASAALVAIIGGFLVSRLVGLSADRQSVRRRRDQLQSEIEVLTVRRSEITAEIRSVARGWFREANLKDFVLPDGPPPEAVDGLINAAYVGTTVDDTRTWMAELTTQAQEARQTITKVMESGERRVPPDEVLRERGIKPENFPEDVFVAVVRQMNRELKTVGLFDTLDIYPSIGPASTLKYTRQDQRIATDEGLKIDIKTLISELNLQERTLAEIAAPEGVRWGIVALATLAILGIVYPMVLMALQAVPDGSFIRITVIVAFVIGLSSVLSFIIWQWHSLATTSDQATT